MGMAIAHRFAREGFDLALLARNPSRLEPLLEPLRASGVTVRSYAADLTDVASVESTLALVQQAQGPAKVMVYNGGVWNEGAPLAMASVDFHRDLALCVSGAYAATRAVQAGMVATGGGTVLFTGGGLALYPQYGLGVLSLVAGKGALRALGLALHEAMKPANIHVGMVTITGTVQAGTAFDPDKIAESYWQLHAQPPGQWTAEIVYQGAA
jgi:short-subunit dehydrogenase